IRGRREAFYQMQLFAGSRNAVRFVKLVVSTISVFRNVLPSPLATNAGLRFARTPCVRGPQACTPAHGSACVHVPCADMHAGEHGWTWLVLTCTGHVQVCIAACRLRDSLVGLRFVQESLPSSVLNPPPVQNSLESPGLVYIIGHSAV